MFLVRGVLQSFLTEVSQVNCYKYCISLNHFIDSKKAFGEKRNIKPTQNLFYLPTRAHSVLKDSSYLLLAMGSNAEHCSEKLLFWGALLLLQT